uniref:Uncharacterized protein n=1 Tax=Lepeophtheirus salmonis TaxID=72036 RepID=A0A0K2UI72_LEPSM
MHPKGRRWGWHQGCREGQNCQKKSSKELERLIQKSVATEEMDFFHWCSLKRPLHLHKALATFFLTFLWTVLYETSRSLLWDVFFNSFWSSLTF